MLASLKFESIYDFPMLVLRWEQGVRLKVCCRREVRAELSWPGGS